MKKRLVLLLTAMLILGLTGSAMANRYDSFSGTADCDGWSVEGAAKIAQADRPGVDIAYTVSLSQDGSILEEQTGIIYVRALMDPDPFSGSGSFDNIPSGLVVVSGTFALPNTDGTVVIESFSVEMTCSEVESATAHRPRYWKRHPELWPVDSVEIAGRTYSKQEAIAQMRGCFSHRVIKRLFRHTLAAKLNAANGVTGEPIMTIADAEDFMTLHGFHSCLPRSVRREARGLKNLLREYNRGDSSKAFEADSADEFDDSADEVTLDDMRAMYR